tara:strand:+ start:749 stop:1102 length:354 start_codon:yes stop_codon:yes gene_type:complete
MLSNHTLASLNTKRDYLENKLTETLPSGLMNILNYDLSTVMGQINEANHRHIVGVTKDGERVYSTVNPYGSTSADKVIYIEGLPSGWDLASFDTTSGSSTEVVIDGGQNWKTTIIFN